MTSALLAPDSRSLRAGRRLEFIDGVRGAAALYVMAHHMSRQIWPETAPASATPQFITKPLHYGHFAVDLFIVLSGFCLMLPVIRAGGVIRGGARGFFWRRARRILPPYYAAMLLSLVLIRLLISRPTGTPWDDCVRVTRAGLVAHLLLLHDLYTAHFEVWKQIDHPLWSVALEFQIYLLFPPLIWLWNRIGGVAATLTGLFFVAVAMVALHFSPIRILCFDYTALFFLGVAASAAAFSEVSPWPTIRRRAPWRAISWIALAAIIALSFRFTEEDGGAILFDPVVGVLSAAVLVSLSNRAGSRVRHVFERKPLVFAGTFSYSLYLIHAPLIQVIWQYFLLPLHLNPFPLFFALLTLGSIAILGVAYAFFFICERPWLVAARNSAQPELAARQAMT